MLYGAYLGFDLGFCGVDTGCCALERSLDAPVASTLDPGPDATWTISCACERDTDWASGFSWNRDPVEFRRGTDIGMNRVVVLQGQ